MATEFDNTNRGAIWPNKEKKSEKQPDFTGKVNVDGTEFRVAAWKRKEDASPKAPSLTFQVEKQEDFERRMQEFSKEQVKQVKATFIDEDIPFAQHDRGMFA